jgi:hypothetical protein
MTSTRPSSTGHFANCQTVIAVSPRPMAPPTASASGPVSTSASAVIATSMMQTNVIRIWSGFFFHTGRPSSTS